MEDEELLGFALLLASIWERLAEIQTSASCHFALLLVPVERECLDQRVILHPWRAGVLDGTTDQVSARPASPSRAHFCVGLSKCLQPAYQERKQCFSRLVQLPYIHEAFVKDLLFHLWAFILCVSEWSFPVHPLLAVTESVREHTSPG